ncbi:MAG: T9SS type A sorting domain-containing protein [Saprospiraceae bacterium]
MLLSFQYAFAQFDLEWEDFGDEPEEQFGFSTSMSAFGNVAVGSPFAIKNGMKTGKVVINDGSDNTSTRHEFFGNEDGDEFGFDIKFSGVEAPDFTGEFLIIGAPGANNNTGYVRVYEIEYFSGRLVQKGDDINGSFPGGRFGHSVTINRSGNIIVIGSPLDGSSGNQAGKTSVFKWDGDNWNLLGDEILGENSGDLSGFDVQIEDFYKLNVVIGEPSNGLNPDNKGGKVRVFKYDGNEFVQEGQTITGQNDGGRFGAAIGLDISGLKLVVGAPDAMGSRGEVQIFKFNTGNNIWNQIGNSIQGDSIGDKFGTAFDFNYDMQFIVVGAPQDSIRPGKAELFFIPSNIPGWIKDATIFGEGVGDRFGTSIDMHGPGGFWIAGSPGNDKNGFNSGRVASYGGLLTRTSDVTQNNAIDLWPNPTAGKLFFNREQPEKISIFDFNGKLVSDYPIKGNSIDVSEFQKGPYLIIMEEKGKKRYGKFIRQ